ncbi:MAG: response regulator [Acidimicrobiales bacterium]|nr:response regulator [Acidimicrobiales bacterium]
MGEAHPPLRLLGVEDDPTDATWLELMLSNADVCPYTLRVVSSMADAQTSMAFSEFDCVLLDLSLPDTEGIESVRRILDVEPSMPVVVFTGTNDQELGLEAIEAGAQDYLVKGQATGNTILRSARWAAARVRARRGAESGNTGPDLLRELAEAWVCLDPDLRISRVNEEFLKTFGLMDTEALGLEFTAVLPREAAGDAAKVLGQVLEGESASVAFPIMMFNRQGRGLRRVMVASRLGTGDGRQLFVVVARPLRK